MSIISLIRTFGRSFPVLNDKYSLKERGIVSKKVALLDNSEPFTFNETADEPEMIIFVLVSSKKIFISFSHSGNICASSIKNERAPFA